MVVNNPNTTTSILSPGFISIEHTRVISISLLKRCKRIGTNATTSCM